MNCSMKGQLLLQNCISLSILSFLNALLFPCTLRAFSSLPVSFTLIKRNIRVTVPAKGPLGHQQPLLIFPCLLLTPRHGPGPHFSPCPAVAVPCPDLPPAVSLSASHHNRPHGNQISFDLHYSAIFPVLF